ncbi:hypothetical protein QN400_24000 [Pseudomonas sp. RTC3]|uniref:hypothetical protein n=1 Tax=Pseudomonas sp. 5C2 TaxID=3048588 RepID=UPI002AB460B7|nr:hypothetical protein [Pseudomonas sp. 5C2]MDY7564716.1 hypothetical protein [Pseudomonas sp. 5C2]MEB0065072.1 hypothetical protein [Pseudomonas sp. RTC3]MEB0243714.1 hypothetical protein [Pseudomonas sp. 5C2]
MKREHTLTLEEFETVMREFDVAGEWMAQELKSCGANPSKPKPIRPPSKKIHDDLFEGAQDDQSWQITQLKAPTSTLVT